MSESQNENLERGEADAPKGPEENTSQGQRPEPAAKIDLVPHITTPETQNMEVHHPHHPSHKKKWTEYLLEFFMLFLAVFLGFVAENIREKLVERHREKEYISSLINDLISDTTKLGKNIVSFNRNILMQDSVKVMISQLSKGFSQSFYRNRSSLIGFSDFIYTDATIEQLKNSGGFRLIRDHKIIDSIMAYDARVNRILIAQTSLSTAYEKLRNIQTEIFDDQELDAQITMGKSLEQLEKAKMNYLITNDKAVLAKFYNEVRFTRWAAAWMITSMEGTKFAATRLIHFLMERYNLQEKMR